MNRPPAPGSPARESAYPAHFPKPSPPGETALPHLLPSGGRNEFPGSSSREPPTRRFSGHRKLAPSTRLRRSGETGPIRASAQQALSRTGSSRGRMLASKDCGGVGVVTTSVGRAEQPLDGVGNFHRPRQTVRQSGCLVQGQPARAGNPPGRSEWEPHRSPLPPYALTPVRKTSSPSTASPGRRIPPAGVRGFPTRWPPGAVHGQLMRSTRSKKCGQREAVRRRNGLSKTSDRRVRRRPDWQRKALHRRYTTCPSGIAECLSQRPYKMPYGLPGRPPGKPLSSWRC